MIPITEKLLTNHNRPMKKLIRLKGVAIHWTANTNNGANAMANRNYFQNTSSSASAHYVVDDKTIVRCIPDSEVAYHVGAKKYTSVGMTLTQGTIQPDYIPFYSPNYFTIGIEMCVNKDGNWTKTYQNTVELAASLLRQYGLSTKDLYRHYDITGKNCPAMMIDKAPWNKFKADVAAEYSKKEIKVPQKLEQPILKEGSKGEYVKELQTILKKLGYMNVVDGNFGPMTKAAVIKFQADNKLSRDGVVGPNTWVTLRKKNI